MRINSMYNHFKGKILSISLKTVFELKSISSEPNNQNSTLKNLPARIVNLDIHHYIFMF